MKKIILTTIMFLTLSSMSHAQLPRKTEWKEKKSNHFIIYYKEAPGDFVESVKDAAEQYYNEITDNLGFTRYKGWTYNERAKIYIYDDQEDYVNTAQAYRWSHGVASARTKTIRTFPTAHGFFDSTLPHELGHIIFREFVGFRVAIPLWFEEGVAMYQEKARRWGANRSVKQAIAKGQYIPISQLNNVRLTTKTPKEVVNLFYAESASIVYYMISELGKFKFLNFCRKLKSGRTFENALRQNYPRFRTFDDLNKAWLKYLE